MRKLVLPVFLVSLMTNSCVQRRFAEVSTIETTTNGSNYTVSLSKVDDRDEVLFCKDSPSCSKPWRKIYVESFESKVLLAIEGFLNRSTVVTRLKQEEVTLADQSKTSQEFARYLLKQKALFFTEVFGSQWESVEAVLRETASRKINAFDVVYAGSEDMDIEYLKNMVFGRDELRSAACSNDLSITSLHLKNAETFGKILLQQEPSQSLLKQAAKMISDDLLKAISKPNSVAVADLKWQMIVEELIFQLTHSLTREEYQEQKKSKQLAHKLWQQLSSEILEMEEELWSNYNSGFNTNFSNKKPFAALGMNNSFERVSQILLKKESKNSLFQIVSFDSVEKNLIKKNGSNFEVCDGMTPKVHAFMINKPTVYIEKRFDLYGALPRKVFGGHYYVVDGIKVSNPSQFLASLEGGIPQALYESLKLQVENHSCNYASYAIGQLKGWAKYRKDSEFDPRQRLEANNKDVSEKLRKAPKLVSQFNGSHEEWLEKLAGRQEAVRTAVEIMRFNREAEWSSIVRVEGESVDSEELLLYSKSRGMTRLSQQSLNKLGGIEMPRISISTASEGLDAQLGCSKQ